MRQGMDGFNGAVDSHRFVNHILFYSSEEQNMLAAISKEMPPIDGVYLTKRDYSFYL